MRGDRRAWKESLSHVIISVTGGNVHVKTQKRPKIQYMPSLPSRSVFAEVQKCKTGWKRKKNDESCTKLWCRQKGRNECPWNQRQQSTTIMKLVYLTTPTYLHYTTDKDSPQMYKIINLAHVLYLTHAGSHRPVNLLFAQLMQIDGEQWWQGIWGAHP